MSMFELKGDVAFVTGAGGGIGRSLAVGLANAGADIALFDLATATGLSETADLVRLTGRQVFIAKGDVTDQDHLETALDSAERALGAVTLAVNAAGIANAAPAEEMPYDQWKKVIDVNLNGVFLSCQSEAKRMLARKRGAIVNIASMSGSIVNRRISQAHYNSSKAAVIHLSKSLAMEWVADGVRVNVVSPGYTATAMNLRPEVSDQMRQVLHETPMGRMADVEEMVGPVVFLLSKAASFVTGADLIVDGGYTCW